MGVTTLLALWIFSSIPGQQGPRSLSSLPLSSLDSEAAVETESALPPAASVGSELSLVIHIVGEVREPGVYLLPIGSRVHDAVAISGGFTPEAEPASLNLARVLSDGEQLWVLSLEEFEEAAPLGGAVSGGLLNLNRADAQAFEELPGIGPTLAARIVDYRNANGPFVRVSDLMRVSGIGEKLFAGLKDLVTV